MRSDRFREIRGQIQMLSVGMESTCSRKYLDKIRQLSRGARADPDVMQLSVGTESDWSTEVVDALRQFQQVA